ncbi:50S ribosomal protein L13 [Candidatus Gracilibacteria bacterium GN02-872]|nr:50S ribosomal protein L13 [Candidatus Gracilibacteria bacterium GN02-872]RKW21028.1 MAG: 50S ribosomal protein L13 [Candidatus Gracilibacteria bacterium]
MKTISPKQVKGNERKWYVIDAKGLTLGRLATKISVILMGKNKASYVPFLDNGDYVIVLNCDKVAVTGKKMTDKTYYSHSGYLGGLKEIDLKDLLAKKPEKVLETAVSGMLPKNKLRASMLARLKLFTGDEHTFVAQNPELIK